MSSSLIMCISKILTELFNKTKSKTKPFCRCCLQCFSSEKVLIEDKKDFSRDKWLTKCKTKKWSHQI